MIGSRSVCCRFRSWFLDDLWIRLYHFGRFIFGSISRNISSPVRLLIFAVGWARTSCWLGPPVAPRTVLMESDIIPESSAFFESSPDLINFRRLLYILFVLVLEVNRGQSGTSGVVLLSRSIDGKRGKWGKLKEKWETSCL